MTKKEEIRVWNANEGYVRFGGAIQHIVVNKITILPNLDAENDNEKKLFVIDCVIGGVAMELERMPRMYANEYECKNEASTIESVCVCSEFYEQQCKYFWDSELLEVHSVYRYELVRELTFNGSCWVAEVIDNRELFDESLKCKHAQDIPVTEADGTTHINKGLRSRLALTDEQKELVKQYEDICNKLMSANVGLVNEDDKTYAYNKSEIERLSACYSYEGLFDDDYEECDVTDFCTRVKDYVNIGGWDNELFVKLPKKNDE